MSDFQPTRQMEELFLDRNGQPEGPEANNE
jgi:hypothetical protein